MGFGAGDGFGAPTGVADFNLLKTEALITAAVDISGGGGNLSKTEAIITTTVVLASGSAP